jgi:hypothetical protein
MGILIKSWLFLKYKLKIKIHKKYYIVKMQIKKELFNLLNF